MVFAGYKIGVSGAADGFLDDASLAAWFSRVSAQFQGQNLIVVLISADIEWREVKRLFPGEQTHPSPYGEWFRSRVWLDGDSKSLEVIYFHGGWGKIAAAGSTQYVIDHWHPELLVNLGTCGGLDGLVDRGTILLVERTLVYDLVEQMGNYDEHIAHYTTILDLSGGISCQMACDVHCWCLATEISWLMMWKC